MVIVVNYTNMSNHDELGILEQKHSLKILVILLDGPQFKGELASKITIGTGSVQSRIEDLKTLGLVDEMEFKIKPFKKQISLTPKGRKIAIQIELIEKTLRE